MSEFRCPGQDMRYWKPEDICLVECPHCQAEIEFWKDEPMRVCSSCGCEVRHPKMDLGCGLWCEHAEKCIGNTSKSSTKIPKKSTEIPEN